MIPRNFAADLRRKIQRQQMLADLTGAAEQMRVLQKNGNRVPGRADKARLQRHAWTVLAVFIGCRRAATIRGEPPGALHRTVQRGWQPNGQQHERDDAANSTHGPEVPRSTGFVNGPHLIQIYHLGLSDGTTGGRESALYHCPRWCGGVPTRSIFGGSAVSCFALRP